MIAWKEGVILAGGSRLCGAFAETGANSSVFQVDAVSWGKVLADFSCLSAPGQVV